MQQHLRKLLTARSGIIGLYTAYSLVDAGVSPAHISVVAEYLPGDESANYTSPYAGGNFSCITDDDPVTMQYDKETYQGLDLLQSRLGGRVCGLDRYTSYEYWDLMPLREKRLSLRSYLNQFSVIPHRRLPEDAAYGISFLSWSFNCPRFLVHLQLYLAKKGVQFRRQRLEHVSEAYGSETKVVFNCTGLGARRLGGVEDSKVYPTRGQVVVVKAPHIRENVMRWGLNSATYIIRRPFSRGQVVLGGFMGHDEWSTSTYRDQTEDILRRTTQLHPRLLTKNAHGSKVADLEVLRVVAGLRPSREGGVRIQREDFEGKVLVHNYGASGYGYQAGLGMAQAAVRLALKREAHL